MLNENVIDLDQMSKVILPRHISVEIDTQRQQRKEERRKRTSSLIFVLPMFPCVSSPVIHFVSLAFRARLCAKNEASEEKATVKR